MSGTAVKRKQHKKQVQSVEKDVNVSRTTHTNSSVPFGPRGTMTTLIIVGLLSTVAYLYYKYMLFESSRTSDSDPDGYPFRVLDIPGKGKGMIASRDIEQGELILREKPLLRVPSQVTTYSPGALLLSSIASLGTKDREAFYNLSYVNFPSDILTGTEQYNDALALAIFQTNAVSAGNGHVGLFPRMARLNHGCSSAFNSVYTWRENEGVLVVYALKLIKMGEELLTTYLDTKRPRNERQRFLREHYGFDCQCNVCSLPEPLSAESDRRLAKMAQLYGRFSSWQHGHLSGREAIDTAREIWTTGEVEGYWSERGQLAADAVSVAAAHSDQAAVRAWAELAKKWYSYELGPDSEQVQWIRQILANPTKHQMWGTRQTEQVGLPGFQLQL